jgi:hypothetical protein
MKEGNTGSGSHHGKKGKETTGKNKESDITSRNLRKKATVIHRYAIRDEHPYGGKTVTVEPAA